ncbi:hypothetical protein, partial [Legionella yabuuchiae]|uniref:hypothetical protein n=1 Tax=Legionella yabuuchiae TaxID=376727 RepID=UPI0010567280
MSILDQLYVQDSKNLNIAFIKTLYRSRPFRDDRSKQYPGNVIQYLLMHVERINPVLSAKEGEYTTAEWIEYKQVCAKRAISLINSSTIDSFAPRDASTSLHRMAKLTLSSV